MKDIYYNYSGLEHGSCSTVIIGKNASTTGKVIMGHNEDDTDCVVQAHLVPRIKHAPGEMITFEDGRAIIPQVRETLAYYWSEVKCDGGISFADGYVNECGVAIVSNACRPSKDATGVKTDNREAYGLGYALRRLAAERAHTAREGVQVMAKLVEEFGYFSSRTYHIADADEAWTVSVPKGHRLVARRVQDDEVYYIPNHYIIHEVDMNDPDNYYASPDLITFAVEQGWYTPAKEGDYSDFDFAKAYQDNYDVMPQANINRASIAWKLLADLEPEGQDLKITALKAPRKYSPEDVKKVLRSHGEGMWVDRTEGGNANPHKGFDDLLCVCNNMTVESTVFVFNDDINLLRMYKANPKPCLSPYVPWYPVALKEIPEGYEWNTAKEAQPSHFRWDEEEYEFDPSRAWWAFKNVQFLTDFNYRATHRPIKDLIAVAETKWEKETAAVEAAYRTLAETDPDAAAEYLSDYTQRQAQAALKWARRTVGQLYLAHYHEDKYD